MTKSISSARQNGERMYTVQPIQSAKKIGMLMYAVRKSCVFHTKNTWYPLTRMKTDVQKTPQMASPGCSGFQYASWVRSRPCSLCPRPERIRSQISSK